MSRLRRNAIGTVHPNPERQIAGLRRMLEKIRKIEPARTFMDDLQRNVTKGGQLELKLRQP